MRYLIAAAVTILIIIVPFGSWYYLHTGLNYRKANIEALKSKGNIIDYTNRSDLFLNKTTLLYNSQHHDFEDEVISIFDQFETGMSFQLLELNNLKNISVASNHLIVPTTVMNEKFDIDNAFALIDTSGSIRNFYKADLKSVTKCVEHVAIVIPVPKKQDIKMKNGKDVDAKPNFMKRNK